MASLKPRRPPLLKLSVVQENVEKNTKAVCCLRFESRALA
jgi:hypothetical protein